MLYFVILSMVQLFCTNQQDKALKQMPPHLLIENCVQKLDYFSVGDVWLSDSNYTQYLKSQKLTLLIASHKGCLSCCGHELIFKRIQDNIQQKQYLKMARIEIQQSVGFLKAYPMIKRFPFILIFRQDHTQPSIYNDILDYDNMINFISSVDENVVQQYNRLQDLEQDFLDPKPYDQMTLSVVKIILLFYDKEELEEEIRAFYQVAEKIKKLNYRIKFATLTNKIELKKAKNKYKSKWFSDYSISSIVIQRHPNGGFHIIDISDVVKGMQNLAALIQMHTIPLVDEFVISNYPFYQKSNKPILTIVLDSIVEVEKSNIYLKTIETQIAKQFDEQILVTWIEGSLNQEKTNMLGLGGWTPSCPGIAFFKIDQEVKVYFPQTWDVYNMSQVSQFVNDYLHQSLEFIKYKYYQDKLQLQWQQFWNDTKQIKNIDHTNKKKTLDQKNFTLIYHVNTTQSIPSSDQILILQERITTFNYNNVLQVCILNVRVDSAQDFEWLSQSSINSTDIILYTRQQNDKYIIDSFNVKKSNKCISKKNKHLIIQFYNYWSFFRQKLIQFQDSLMMLICKRGKY